MPEEVKEKPRKMAFFEIASGSFAAEAQEVFERIQRAAIEHGAKATMSLKITVTPPEEKDERFGGIGYEIRESLPVQKSVKYTTELVDGIISTTGENVEDLLQMNLQFPNISVVKGVKHG